MILRLTLLLALACTSTGFAQAGGRVFAIPPETPLAIQVDQQLPMRLGTPVRARLLYPVYVNDTLLLPADTLVLGSITALRPDAKHRLHARLNFDFTPFHTPVVRFTQIQLADGSTIPLDSDDATEGAPIFRILAPPPRQGGFLHQQFDQGKQMVRDRIAVFTGPDKKERLVQLLYSQLPYHPEYVARKTAWTVETTSPFAVSRLPPQPARPAATQAGDAPPTWMVQAYLKDALNSATTQPGKTIKATVAEPIYNPDGTVAVPQGATLVGAVTRSKPARRFARAGDLSFSFRQLVLPGGDTQSVQTSLKGADAATSADLAMTSEGDVKPKAQDKIVVPLILIFLAARPFDRDGHRFAKDGVASNSLGFLGFLVGTAARQPNVAVAIGAYGAALSLYNRWFARGKEVTFAKNTRVVIQTTGRRSEAIKPATATP